MQQCSLSINDLGCERGGRQIFAHLAFDLSAGALLLLRGPNGAGKTTLLLCVARILHHSAGQINWLGVNPESPPEQDLHFAGQQFATKPQLTLAENLRFWAKINGGGPQEVTAALKNAELEPLADLRAGILSSGQARRLSLARLLVSPRPLWLLDEPTTNLDKKGEQWVASLLATHLASGGIAIVATHQDLPLSADIAPKILELGRVQ